MASGPGGEINEPPTPSVLDVLYAKHFEGVAFDPQLFEAREEKLYKGAPPEWLDFHIGEQAEKNGFDTPFIMRDSCGKLEKQIFQRSNDRNRISRVKLFHQPGCGGTTLAMQAMWNFRNDFRCAVLTDSAADITDIAEEVVQLFKGGRQKTVLLLLNEESMLEKLQNSIMKTIADQSIEVRKAVAILFTCVRKDQVLCGGEHVALERALSDTEKQRFDAKLQDLQRRYGARCRQFHGFNIMQTNFSKGYILEACAFFSKVKRANRSRKTQLVGFLALLNAYVPGSYLLESQCLDFLAYDHHDRDLSLEDIMEPFSHLIVIFQQNANSERRVRIVHPMIAQRGTELMAERGVTRSDTARNLLNGLCSGDIPSCFKGFVKDMLTKRHITQDNPNNSTEIDDKKEMFSRLILDIQEMEDRVKGQQKKVLKSSQSASVLKVASKRFDENQFFPQALARVYYIKLMNYNRAEMWANVAKERDPQNSCVADTLGQIHKNHLNNVGYTSEREILQLAEKAIKAFKHEEQLAENECDRDSRGDGMTKVSHDFNTRGQFGFLQVCIILYNYLQINSDESITWESILQKEVSMCQVLTSLGDNKLYRFNGLINSLRDDVEKKCDFLNAFLTYSKPGMHKEDKPYILEDVVSCYRNYIKHPRPELVKEIIEKFEADVEDNMSVTDRNTTEGYIVALLKSWSQDNFKQLIERLDNCYEREYANYYRSRYLQPLFYLGASREDETARRIVPRLMEEILPDANADLINSMIGTEKIFEDLRVQKNLTKFHGVIQNYSIVTTLGGQRIHVKANKQEKLWTQREVSFYLGFNISGLLAFGITTRRNEHPGNSDKDSHEWIPVEPRPAEYNSPTNRLHSGNGHFECSVSALRWVCNDKVSFTYQFTPWETHRQELDKVNCKPGGTLLEIRVTEGKLDEVYLPHWICTDDTSLSDKFAVLHNAKGGNFLQQASEVKDGHVKLTASKSFSEHGVLIRTGFPLQVYCNLLIYWKDPKLYIYLIVRCPAIKQAVESMETNRGSKLIHRENLEKALQMSDSFFLTTDAKTATVSPAQVQLQEEVGGGQSACSEVSITKTKTNIKLTLRNLRGDTVWCYEVTKGVLRN